MKRIKALDSLRLVFMGLIFLSHLSFLKDEGNFFNNLFFQGGPAGVTYFIVLSGFVMGLKYKDEFQGVVTLKDSFQFSYKRIKKFIPIHLFSFLLVLPLCIKQILYPISFLFKLFFNITLLQTWIPNMEFYFSFNAVSWYLSLIAFFYFITPYVINRTYKLFKIVGGGILILLTVQIVYTFLFKNNANAHWFVYIFPLYRGLDYLQGLLLAKLYIVHKNYSNFKRLSVSQWTLIEILCLSCYLLLYLLATRIDISFIYDIYFLPVTMILIFVFAISKGKFSQYLDNSSLASFAKDIMYFFMLHQFCIRYISVILLKFNVNGIVISMLCLITSILSVKMVKIMFTKIGVIK